MLVYEIKDEMEEKGGQEDMTPEMSYRRRVLDAVCNGMLDTLYTEVPLPTPKTQGITEEDNDAFIAKSLSMNGFDADFTNKVLAQSKEISENTALAKQDLIMFADNKQLVGHQPDRENAVPSSSYTDMKHTYTPMPMAEVDEAIPAKTVTVYFPKHLKLTDEHLAHMDNARQDVIWPYRWEFTDNHPGTFICVVERLDDHLYRFKVKMLDRSPGERDLTRWLELFSLISQLGAGPTTRERAAIIQRADMMLVKATQTFFRDQLLVDPYTILIFRSLPCADDVSIVRKTSMVTKRRDLEPLPFYSNLFHKIVRDNDNLIYYRRSCRPVDTHRVISRKPKYVLENNSFVHFLMGIFGFNEDLYENDCGASSSGITITSLSGLCEPLSALHLNQEQLQANLDQANNGQEAAADVRIKG